MKDDLRARVVHVAHRLVHLLLMVGMRLLWLLMRVLLLLLLLLLLVLASINIFVLSIVQSAVTRLLLLLRVLPLAVEVSLRLLRLLLLLLRREGVVLRGVLPLSSLLSQVTSPDGPDRRQAVRADVELPAPVEVGRLRLGRKRRAEDALQLLGPGAVDGRVLGDGEVAGEGVDCRGAVRVAQGEGLLGRLALSDEGNAPGSSAVVHVVDATAHDLLVARLGRALQEGLGRLEREESGFKC